MPSPNVAQLGRPCSTTLGLRAMPTSKQLAAIPIAYPRRTPRTPRRVPCVRADTETKPDTAQAEPTTPPAQWSAVDTQLRDSEAARLPEELVYVAPTDGDRTWTSLKLAFALPWRRFTNDSVLTIKVRGVWLSTFGGSAVRHCACHTESICLSTSYTPHHTLIVNPLGTAVRGRSREAAGSFFPWPVTARTVCLPSQGCVGPSHRGRVLQD